jgi:hypothetical protein
MGPYSESFPGVSFLWGGKSVPAPGSFQNTAAGLRAHCKRGFKWRYEQRLCSLLQQFLEKIFIQKHKICLLSINAQTTWESQYQKLAHVWLCITDWSFTSCADAHSWTDLQRVPPCCNTKYWIGWGMEIGKTMRNAYKLCSCRNRRWTELSSVTSSAVNEKSST